MLEVRQGHIVTDHFVPVPLGSAGTDRKGTGEIRLRESPR